MLATRAHLPHALASVLIAIPLVACGARSSGVAPGPAADSPRTSVAEALTAFDVVAQVLQHPRCMNCHPVGERPLQFDASTPHAMNVVRGADDRGAPGMRCAGCHAGSNPDVSHLPPGVSSEWRLAPRSMAFEGLSKAELAQMLLDEERSHLSPEELVRHVEADPLVRWGWEPGPGRAPVPVPHARFAAAFRTWIEAGAPVPAPQD